MRNPITIGLMFMLLFLMGCNHTNNTTQGLSGSTLSTGTIILQPELQGSYNIKPNTNIQLPRTHYQATYNAPGNLFSFVVESLMDNFSDVIVTYSALEKKTIIKKNNMIASIQQITNKSEIISTNTILNNNKIQECYDFLNEYKNTQGNYLSTHGIADIYVSGTNTSLGQEYCEYTLTDKAGNYRLYTDILRGNGYAGDMGVNSVIDSTSIHISY